MRTKSLQAQLDEARGHSTMLSNEVDHLNDLINRLRDDAENWRTKCKEVELEAQEQRKVLESRLKDAMDGEISELNSQFGSERNNLEDHLRRIKNQNN